MLKRNFSKIKASLNSRISFFFFLLTGIAIGYLLSFVPIPGALNIFKAPFGAALLSTILTVFAILLLYSKIISDIRDIKDRSREAVEIISKSKKEEYKVESKNSKGKYWIERQTPKSERGITLRERVGDNPDVERRIKRSL